MSEIVDRVADVIRAHLGCIGASYCSSTSHELAEVLVSELGLRAQYNDRSRFGMPREVRYTTKWVEG